MRFIVVGVAFVGLLLMPMVTRADASPNVRMPTTKAGSIDAVTGRSGAREALDRSHTEWMQFREVNCMVPGAIAAGGSGSGSFVVGPQIEITRSRLVALQNVAGGKAGPSPPAEPVNAPAAAT